MRFIMLNVQWSGNVVFVHKDQSIGDILSIAVPGYSETIKVPAGQCVSLDDCCGKAPDCMKPEPPPAR